MASDIIRKNILELFEQSQNLLENTDTIPEAIEKLELILNVDPNHAPTNFSLGYAYYLLGDIEESIKYFTKAKELDYPQEKIDVFINELISRERSPTKEVKELVVDEEKSISTIESPEEIPEVLVTEPSVTTFINSNKVKLFLLFRY